MKSEELRMKNVPDVWFLVLGAWFLVLGAWCLVLGSWCLVLGSWFFEGIVSKAQSTRY